MTEEQPLKKPRAFIDKSRLSSADQLAFARVAKFLNKPLSELYEESSRHTIVEIEGIEEEIRNEESNHAKLHNWPTSTTQSNAMGDWQQTAGNRNDPSTIHEEGGWAERPETDFVERNLNGMDFSLWADGMSQISPLQVLNTNDTGHSEDLRLSGTHLSPGWSHEATTDEPWASIPTSYLAQASAEMFPSRRGLSVHSPLRQNILDSTLNHKQTSPLIESGKDESTEQDLIVLNSQLSGSEHHQHSSSPKVPSSNWSSNELSNTYNTFNLDNVSPKSPKWVSLDPSTKEIVPQRPQRRGPFQDQQLRVETSNTRKLKACVRCRMQKIRCTIDNNNPGGTCQTCQDVSKQKIHTLPCVRYKLTECTLYRTGRAPGLEFTFRWPVMKLKDISDWSDREIRTIKVVSDVCPVPLELSVRRFIPIPQDSLEKSWMDGKVKKSKSTTPFAIVNMSATVNVMREYIDKHVFACMEFWLDGRDPLIQETYKFARQYMLVAEREEAFLLAEFFRLWFAVRRTATTEFIDGKDTLDMKPETTDRSYPLFGKVPIPPVMIQQLDMILTLSFLQPLRKKVLEDIQKIVLNNKPKSWMTIYLATFMSLHCAATVTAENYQNARKHGLKRRFALPTFISERHQSANVFLTHYHYCTKPCNPFNIDWRKRQTTPFSGMTTNEIDFLLKTAEMVKERQAKFRRIRENELYEDDFYFVSQLFDEKWEAVDTIIDYGDETIFGEPLRQSGSPKRNENVSFGVVVY